MKYDLCKQLKDAGFPQEEYYDGEKLEHPDINYPPDKVEEGKIWMDEHAKWKEALAYAPTLSELIEACDPHKADAFMLETGDNWIASYDYEGYFEHNEKFKEEDGIFLVHLIEPGHTPEEAVARLWLALQASNNS